MNYLKMKNRIFMTAFREFWKQKRYENIYYMQGNTDDLNLVDYNDYWDLIGLFFKDEEDYNRALFMPVPLLPKKYREKLRDMAWKGEIMLCSRAWHEISSHMYLKPTSFYPDFFYEKVYEKDFEDNEEEQ